MANSDEISLTRALYGLTKNTAKIAFLFLLISAILISITYNDADPSFSTHTLVNNQEKVLYNFHVSESDSKLHIGYFTNNGDMSLVDYIDFRIQKQSIINGSVSLFTEVIISQTTQFYRELSLESGDYRVLATLHLKSNAPANTRIDIVSGYGNLNLVLVALSILTLIIGSISLGLFFAILPFTIFVLIVNGINKSKQQPHPRPKPYVTRRAGSDNQPPQATTQTSDSVIQPQTVQLESETVHRQELSRPYRFDPNSFASKLTARDWAWLIIALISFIGFIFDPSSPFLIFSIIITAVVIYSVSEREKTKYRLLILLKTNPETSVGFLSRQLGKKDKYIIKILQIMILDEAMPIVLNLSSNHVRVIGSLDPFIEDNQRTYHPLTPTQPVAAVFQDPGSSEMKDETTLTASSPPQYYDILMHCTACGEGLIGSPKYCYICGQKTI